MSQLECPVCHNLVPTNAGYPSWCEQCGWNIHPQQPKRAQNVFESAYGALGRRQSQALFDRFVKAKSLKPSISLSRGLAFILASAVHATTLAVVVLGIVMLIFGWPNLFAILGALLCLGIAWVLRPRFSKMPNDVLQPSMYPGLYKVVNAVAGILGAGQVCGIVVEEHFDAAFEQVGWRQDGILHLGLPLWAILDDQEKVALIAHELAHSVNGDVIRTLYVGSAISTLSNWYSLLYPEHIWPPNSGIRGLLSIPVNLTLLGLSGMVWLIAYMLGLMLWRDSQRAEYQADCLAAMISGTQAMLSLLEKLHFKGAFDLTVQSFTLRQRTDQDFFEALRQRLEEVPQRELERVRRVQLLELSRLDVTHPPTAYRIRLLQAHPAPAPSSAISALDWEWVDRELEAIKVRVQKKLVNQYTASLYQ